MELRATQIVWRGAGCPAPLDPDGVPLRRRAGGLAPVCAMCAAPDPGWTSDDAMSDNFRPLTHVNQLFAHATEGFPVSLCEACVWCARALKLRCAAWIAREDGVWFVARRDLLGVLLDPPEPPFVVGLPLYGADHGGEANGWRATWSNDPPLPAGVDRLTRLQAKHVAIYAAAALRRERYPLQWDDHTRVTVDVVLWRALASRLGVMAALLRGHGVGVTDVRDALRTLRAPMRAPLVAHRDWPALVRELAPHARAPWWPLLTDIVPLLDAPPRPEKTAKAAPAPAPAPVPAPQPAAPPRAQLSLF